MEAGSKLNCGEVTAYLYLLCAIITGLASECVNPTDNKIQCSTIPIKLLKINELKTEFLKLINPKTWNKYLVII